MWYTVVSTNDQALIDLSGLANLCSTPERDISANTQLWIIAIHCLQNCSIRCRFLLWWHFVLSTAMTEKTKKATGKENVGTLASITVLICILLCECNAEAPHLARWLSSRLFCEDRNLVEKLLVFVLCIQYGKQNWLQLDILSITFGLRCTEWLYCPPVKTLCFDVSGNFSLMLRSYNKVLPVHASKGSRTISGQKKKRRRFSSILGTSSKRKFCQEKLNG